MQIRALSCGLVVALGALLLVHGGRMASGDDAAATPAASGRDGIFASKGLTNSANVLVIADEASVHDAVGKIAALQAKLDSEEKAMGGVTEAFGIVVQDVLKLEEQLAALDKQIKETTDPTKRETLIGPHNEYFRQLMEKGSAIDQLRAREAKIEDFQAPYADAVAAAKAAADSASGKYAALAGDSALKSSIDAYNATSTDKLKLGPSAQFAGDVATINKCLYNLAMDVIPAPIDHGIPYVQVTMNGKTQPMVWDSGASVVSLSSETATAMGLHATDADRTIEMTVANGKKVSAKLIIAPEIRVGPFIAKKVYCVINPPGDPRPPDLLGETFQCLFLSRMDQHAQLLHLSPIGKTVELAPDAKPAEIAAQKTSIGAQVVHIAQLPPVPAGQDVFAFRGLTKLGTTYELSQETDVHSATNGVNKWKSKVVTETYTRTTIVKSMDAAVHEYDNLQARLKTLDTQLKAAKNANDPVQYNQLVEPFNRAVDLVKRKWQIIQDDQAKAATLDDSRPMYSEALVEAVRSANAVSDQYGSLAADPPLKAALAKANTGATDPLKLGPTAQFTMDLTALRKAATDMASDGIAIQLVAGIPRVPVTINGKTQTMLWDSGASYIAISTETAAAYGLHAGDSDLTAKTTLADGKIYDCKVVMITEVRVGPYIAHDIRCMIWPPGTAAKSSLLGGAFQRHFQSRLDEQAGVLRLTPNDDSAIVAADARPLPPGPVQYSAAQPTVAEVGPPDSGTGQGGAGDSTADQPFEQQIEAFEAADKTQPPPANATEFVGGGGVVFWTTLATDFPGVPIIKRGLDGSEISDNAKYADRIIIPYHPKRIVLCAGDRDLDLGKSPKTVANDFQAFIRAVHSALPGTPIYFISIKPSIQRWNLADKIRQTNELIEEGAARDRTLHYVDVFTPMLGSDGTPRKELFEADGLHLARAGYELWVSILGPMLKE